MAKQLINGLVFAATILYGVWVFWLLLGAVFVLGNNDTPLEVIGILAGGLCPIPASLIALRRRRLAALSFAVAAALWIASVIDGDLYLAKRFGHLIIPRDMLLYLLRTSVVPLFLAFFYLFTDLLGWPLLWPRSSQTRGQHSPLDETGR